MTGFRWLSNSLLSCALDESSLSIGRINPFMPVAPTLPDYFGDIYQLQSSENSLRRNADQKVIIKSKSNSIPIGEKALAYSTQNCMTILAISL